MDLLITILAIPTVSFIAYFFGRNPFRWAIYAYLLEFWVLIPLFIMNKKQTPAIPKSLRNRVTVPIFKLKLKKVRTLQDF
jgi:hypothetical protein